MGLESVLKFELYDLGYKQLTIENGSISLDGTLNDVIQFNLWCRTAGPNGCPRMPSAPLIL